MGIPAVPVAADIVPEADRAGIVADIHQHQTIKQKRMYKRISITNGSCQHGKDKHEIRAYSIYCTPVKKGANINGKNDSG